VEKQGTRPVEDRPLVLLGLDDGPQPLDIVGFALDCHNLD
jgi:hypothetical protein